jgi:LacI family transcriptional regulator
MTVSRVLSGNARVSKETRLRVQAAIRQLKYSPNIAARNLARASSIHIGLLYNNPSAAYLNEFLVGVLEQSRNSGCQIVLEQCSAHNQRNVVRKLSDGGVDGVILPPPLSDSKGALQAVASVGLPFVEVATGRPSSAGLSVGIDDAEAAAAMTRYLLSLGHRKIGFILGASNQRASGERYQGFLAALKQANLSTRPEWVKRGSFTYRSGLIAAEEILSRAERPTAIFASNDDMAAGVVAVAHRLQIDVPGQLAIAGFDDTPLASTIWPALTTIRQPVAAMARKSLELLLDEIRLRRQGETQAPSRQLFKFSLIKRESTGTRLTVR